MPDIKFIDIRGVEKGSNVFLNFRPSGTARIIKATLEYTFFQAALTYGFAYNGFGVHSYYLQKMGIGHDYGQWARTKTLTTSFARYLVLSLPFFYLKEVIYGKLDNFTKEKPKFKKLLNYSFVVSFFATALSYPLFYLMQKRKPLTALRGCLVLCVFSMVNDLFIDFRRKDFISRNFTATELQQNFVKNRMADIREQVNEEMKDDRFSLSDKDRLKSIDYDAIEKSMIQISRPQTQQTLDKLREQQLQELGRYMKEQIPSLFKKML